MSDALSNAQLQAAVWADRRARVHAVVDGAVVPGLSARLSASESNGWDCLQRGALSPDAAATAAYLVELAPGAPLSQWLLSEAVLNHPGWGVVLVSHHALLPVREHCRGLAEVITPDGERRRWRWWDPEVLGAMLPQFAPSQLDELFALGQQLVLPGRSSWTWHALVDGVLASTVRNVQAPSR